MPTGLLTIETTTIEFQTDDVEIDLIDLTPEIRQFIQSTKISDGKITVFVPGSTGAILTTEYEPGLIQDTKDILQKLVKKYDNYQHDRIDNNAHSHLRTTIIGSEITIPIISSKPTLGTWQQICFADFDNRPRRRRVVFQIIGIKPE